MLGKLIGLETKISAIIFSLLTLIFLAFGVIIYYNEPDKLWAKILYVIAFIISIFFGVLATSSIIFV